MIYIIHSTQRELPNCLLAGLCALAIGVVLDIIRYYRLQSYGASSFTRLGVLVFTLLMGFYLFREQTRALKLKQRENVLFISEITTAFARVIDMKDSYTNGHSTRVAKYTAGWWRRGNSALPTITAAAPRKPSTTSANRAAPKGFRVAASASWTFLCPAATYTQLTKPYHNVILILGYSGRLKRRNGGYD